MAFLKEIYFEWDKIKGEDIKKYPYNIKAYKDIFSIDLDNNVTFFVGENGSGKSTLLEAIATKCNFNTIGGKDSIIEDNVIKKSLSDIIKLSWLPKVNNGFFFRAETLYNFACYIDELKNDDFRAYLPYGGKSLHEQSHGQAFLSLFSNRFSQKGMYILDEPESALSPMNQIVFLNIIKELEKSNNAQFIICTHSPILMAYMGAKIYSFDSNPLSVISYEETDHYKITKDFLMNRERYFKYINN